MTTINRHNQAIQCKLTLLDGETLRPKYLLETICRGFKNSYSITAKICGLVHCRESSLYLSVYGVECLNLDNTNEETLINEAVEDIFAELTQENY